MAPVCEAIVPADEEAAEDPVLPQWTSEPESLEQLLDAYIIESKISGRHPGTSLFLTMATKRDGQCTDVLPDQKYKLFLVVWLYSIGALRN